MITVSDARLRFPQTAICDVPSNISRIISSLHSPSISGFVEHCKYNTWRVKLCSSGYPSICVNCTDPCKLSACSALSPFYVGPSDSTNSCPSLSTLVRVLAVRYLDYAEPTSLIGAVITPTKFTAQINLVLSKESTVMCAAFPRGSKPATIGVITRKKFMVSTPSKTPRVVISGLTPSTYYDVYCVPKDTNGIEMTLSDVIKTKMQTRTLCCSRVATIAINTDYMPQRSTGRDLISISLNTKPSYYLQVNISAYFTRYENLTTNSTFVYLNSTLSYDFINPGSLLTTLPIPLDWTVNPGRVYLQAVYTTSRRSSTEEYEIAYFSDVNSFLVLNDNEQPSTPQVKEARFSSDGKSVVVSFDRATNMANSNSSQFDCQTMFDFDRINYATCIWTSESKIEIVLDRKSPLTDGSLISFFGNTRAKCFQSVLCRTWNISDSRSLFAKLPISSAGLEVTVAVVYSVKSSRESPLLLDFSSSTGNCGREWYYTMLSVNGSDAIVSSSAESYFDVNYEGAQRCLFPANFFQTVGVYDFTVTLCNILSVCGSTTVSVTITNTTIPSVVIYGEPSRTITRSQDLQLFAEVINGKSYATSELYISWEASVDSEVLSLRNYAKDSYSYRIPGYLLTSGYEYTITVKALDRKSLGVSTYAMSVLVESQGVIANIVGGVIRYLRVGEVMLLDGTTSYDADISPLLNRIMDLKFAWRCVSTWSTKCNVNFLTPANESQLWIQSPYDALIGGSDKIYLTVYDSSRSSSTYIEVFAIDKLDPMLEITSSSYSTSKFNVNSKLSLYGQLVFYDNTTSYDGSVVWNVNDSSIRLSTMALTNTTIQLTDAYDKGKFISFQNQTILPMNLAIGYGTLPAGKTLLFTLSCILSSGKSFSTSYTVVTNDVPSGGSFAISPRHGVSLVDIFAFSVRDWSDDDLPLLYSFGNIWKDNYITIQKPSEKTYTTTYLPPGSLTDNFTVTCQTRIYDSLGALTTSGVYVIVESFNDTAMGFNYLASTINSWSTDADVEGSIQKGLSVTIPLVATVLCTNAPNCTALNRYACDVKEDTCGKCYSGYLGDDDEANTLCYSIDDMFDDEGNGDDDDNDRRKLLYLQHNANISCLASIDCKSWQYCGSDRICHAKSKQCSESCNSVGTCQYYSIESGQLVSNCTLDNPYCEARCSCNTGYAGTSCSTTESALNYAHSLRYAMIRGLYNLTKIQTVTLSNVQSWSYMLISLVTREDDINTYMAPYIDMIVLEVLLNANALGGNYEEYIPLLGVVDLTARYVSNHTLPGDIFRDELLIRNFNNLTMSSLVYGEDPVSIIKKRFRTKVMATAVKSNSIAVSTSLSTIEKYRGVKPFELRVTGVDNVTSTILALTLMSPKYYRLSDTRLGIEPSYRLFRQINTDIDVFTSAHTTTSITIQNSEPKTYLTRNTSTEDFNVFCNYEVSTHSHVCGYGGTLTAQCVKTFRGWINTTCPYYTILPTCAKVTLLGQIFDSVCDRTSFDAYTTVCTCKYVSRNSNQTTMGVFDGVSDSTGLSSRDGYQAYLGVSKVTEYEAQQIAVFVPSEPTYMPTARPTTISVVQATRLADTLGSTMLRNVTVTYVFIVLMVVIITIGYVVLSNRLKVLYDSDMVVQRPFEDNNNGSDDAPVAASAELVES